MKRVKLYGIKTALDVTARDLNFKASFIISSFHFYKEFNFKNPLCSIWSFPNTNYYYNYRLFAGFIPLLVVVAVSLLLNHSCTAALTLLYF